MASGGCLAPEPGPDGGAGAAAVVADCATTTARWNLRADHQIEGPDGACLTAGSSASTALHLLPCAGSAQQRWTLIENGQLRRGDSMCLAVAGAGTSLELALCGSDQTTPHFSVPARQRWTLSP